ncbi:MAG: FIST C-terminal domain-containing protein [Patulibacter sp.]|nr:FIST C-terminal domain-containing protein [Patulibacter sp.]
MTVVVGCGSSATSSAARGVAEAARSAAAELGDRPCGLALVFVAGDLAPAADAVLDVVAEELDPAQLVACTASGILSGAEELTTGPAVVIWAMALSDGASVELTELTAEQVDAGIAVRGLPDADDDGERTSAVILLVDPAQLPLDVTLRAFEERLPTVPVIGGVASLIPRPDAPLLCRPGSRGDAGLALRFRGVDVLPCVSQGARPIGPELTVTAGGAGAIHQLAGRPAIDVLRETINGLPDDEGVRIQHGLLLGVAVGGTVENAGDAPPPDDYIVRGLAAADTETGAVAIGAPVEVGQTVRLHVRDPETASRDLVDALRLRREAAGSARIAGALAFTCNGRGREMFGFDDHDADTIQHELGPVPLAGMVSAGEIGPVGGRPFAHSFTATVAVFLA